MESDDLAHQRQSEPEPGGLARARVIALSEAVEDVRQQLRRDTLAGVLHGELGESPSSRSATVIRPPDAGELHRVRKQVARPPAADGRDRARSSPAPGAKRVDDLDALWPPRPAAPRRSRAAPRARVAPGAPPSSACPVLDAAEIQQIIDHFQLRLRALLDARRDRRDFGIAAALQGENAVPAEDGIERRAQLVRDHRQELVLRAVGGLRRSARSPLPRSSRASSCSASSAAQCSCVTSREVRTRSALSRHRLRATGSRAAPASASRPAPARAVPAP